jgi:hypothetical protein
MSKKPYPKKAMPLDTPFKIAGYDFVGLQFFLNASNPEMENLGLYAREAMPFRQWELFCSDGCENGEDDAECLVTNQAKYKFIFDWKDRLIFVNEAPSLKVVAPIQ